MSSRLSFSFFAALAVFLVTTRASAQTITVAQEVSLPRVDASGQPLAKRPLPLHPEAINAQDCRDDQRIRFPVQMTDFEVNAKVEMWASGGSDCSMAVNRKPDTGSCWRLPPGDLPLQQQVTVDVPVRSILSPTSDESICGKLDLTVIDVQFLMFEGGDYVVPVITKHVAITADTVGPEPPDASVSPGNGRARIDIRTLNELATVTELSAYCEKSAANDSCSATALVPGRQPDASRECGRIAGNTGSTFFTEPLENGANHVVAIAARDAFGNVGPLSSVACTRPSPDAETKVQSLDEPTGCAIGPARTSRTSGAVSVASAFGVAALVAARRRRVASGGR